MNIVVVVWVWLQEYACTLEDVVARRTRLAFLDAAATDEVLPAVAAIMAKKLKYAVITSCCSDMSMDD